MSTVSVENRLTCGLGAGSFLLLITLDPQTTAVCFQEMIMRISLVTWMFLSVSTLFLSIYILYIWRRLDRKLASRNGSPYSNYVFYVNYINYSENT